MGEKGKKGKGKGKVSFFFLFFFLHCYLKVEYLQSELSGISEIKESRYLCDHVHVPSSSLGLWEKLGSLSHTREAGRDSLIVP